MAKWFVKQLLIMVLKLSKKGITSSSSGQFKAADGWRYTPKITRSQNGNLEGI